MLVWHSAVKYSEVGRLVLESGPVLSKYGIKIFCESLVINYFEPVMLDGFEL